MSDPARAAALAGGTLVDARRLSGGSLSQVARLRLVDGRLLIAKICTTDTCTTARAEADMLRAIAATGAPAPEVVAVADDLLVMTAAPADGRLDGKAWQALATALASLHAPTGDAYGWPVDHAFGEVAILNARSEDWPAFWAARRLRCHLPHVEPELGRRLARLADRLGDLLPARPPAALLHGDLWGGNVLVGANGAVTLIDPACYHGDREVDIAMLTLFDAPPPRFLEALDLSPGWRERLPIYRLWPLLVHLRLFGASYRAQVEDALVRVGA